MPSKDPGENSEEQEACGRYPGPKLGAFSFYHRQFCGILTGSFPTHEQLLR